MTDLDLVALEIPASLPNINDSRLKILKTNELLQQTKNQLEELKKRLQKKNDDGDVVAVSEGEWKIKVEEFENKKKALEKNLSEIFDKKFKEDLKTKLNKIRRHQEQARKKEAEKRFQIAEFNKNKHKELKKILEKVRQLRDLRRERFKREGHFFPEEDDEFFNRIASLNDVMNEEEARLDQERDAAAEHKRNETIDAGMKERERERDPVYEYWHQAEIDLDSLVSIRYKWDAYIVPPGTNGASCIPPTFVQPSPPANYIWASCLTHGIDHHESNQQHDR
ncbi:11151_t:CDS:2 [Entrophospora sp. SA101]|nr:11151_t:CDS:2 [Entrophospora sp. SA101]